MARGTIAIALGLVLGGGGMAAAQPANDECASATAIPSLPFSESLDASAATTNPADPLLPCASDLPIGDGSVWYTYTAPEDVVLEVDTRTSTYRTTVAVWGGGCGTFDRLACSNYTLPPGTDEWDLHGRAFVTVKAGQTVHIEVASAYDAPATLNLAVGRAPTGHPAPIGPEFVVNTTEYSDQGRYAYSSSIDACRSTNGEFVVAWEAVGDLDGDATGVFARRFAADGTPHGAEFQVNVYTTGYQYRPSVACGPGGQFVVAWRDGDPSAHVKARLFDDAGAAVTGDIPVTVGGDYPAVGMDSTGAFVVAWANSSVYTRRFDATGSPSTAATSLGATGDHPDLGVASDGSAVVAWRGADASARAQRLDSAGTPSGSEIVVATPPGIYVRQPAVSVATDGAFVVVWEDYYPVGFDEIRARTYSPTDVPGPIQVVSEFQNFNVIDSDVALDDAGDFVVTWSDYYYTYDVLGRRVRADGTKIGDAEMSMTTVAAGPRGAAHVTNAVAGEFVVAWVSKDGEVDYPTDAYFGGGYGVRAQRFTFAPAPVPACPAAPSTGCKQPAVDFKGKLKIKDKADDPKDVLVWKWVNGAAVLPGELGDPVGEDGYALCLYDASATLVTEALVPGGGDCGGKPCWKAINNGFVYQDKAAANGGVKKLLVKAADAGKAKLVVKAKGAALGTPSLPLALPATLQLHGTSGTCWSAEFRVDGVQRNTTDAFGGQAQASS
jgi:hypothetical protein